jgi:HK97 family phage prohead protease
MEYKNILTAPLDIDTTGRRVKVVISEMGSKDSDEDIIDEKAYNKTVPERGPAGAKIIWHLTDHNASLKSAVGKPQEISIVGNQLIMLTPIAKTTWGNDVLEHYNNGNINNHSVGFHTNKSFLDEKTGVRTITDITLWEGSSVLWGANPNTPTLSVGKSGLKETSDELNKELNLLLKSFRDGRYTDDAFELIEIRIKQIQDRLNILLKNAIPAAIAPEPDELKEFADRLLLLTLTN